MARYFTKNRVLDIKMNVLPLPKHLGNQNELSVANTNEIINEDKTSI